MRRARAGREFVKVRRRVIRLRSSLAGSQRHTLVSRRIRWIPYRSYGSLGLHFRRSDSHPNRGCNIERGPGPCLAVAATHRSKSVVSMARSFQGTCARTRRSDARNEHVSFFTPRE